MVCIPQGAQAFGPRRVLGVLHAQRCTHWQTLNSCSAATIPPELSATEKWKERLRNHRGAVGQRSAEHNASCVSARSESRPQMQRLGCKRRRIQAADSVRVNPLRRTEQPSPR